MLATSLGGGIHRPYAPSSIRLSRNGSALKGFDRHVGDDNIRNAYRALTRGHRHTAWATAAFMATNSMDTTKNLCPMNTTPTHVDAIIKWLASRPDVQDALPAGLAVHELVTRTENGEGFNYDLGLVAITTAMLSPLLCMDVHSFDEFGRLVASFNSSETDATFTNKDRAPSAEKVDNPYVCGFYGGCRADGRACRNLGLAELGGRCKHHCVGSVSVGGQDYSLSPWHRAYDNEIPRTHLTGLILSPGAKQMDIKFNSAAAAKNVCPPTSQRRTDSPVPTRVPNPARTGGKAKTASTRPRPAATAPPAAADDQVMMPGQGLMDTLRGWLPGNAPPAEQPAINHDLRDAGSGVYPDDSSSQAGGVAPVTVDSYEATRDVADSASPHLGKMVRIQSGKYANMEGLVTSVSISQERCRVRFSDGSETGWLKCEIMEVLDVVPSVAISGGNSVADAATDHDMDAGSVVSAVSIASHKSGFAEGDPVLITNGMYAGQHGVIERLTQSRVKVNINGQVTGGLPFTSVVYGTPADVASNAGSHSVVASDDFAVAAAPVAFDAHSVASSHHSNATVHAGFFVGQDVQILSGKYKDQTGQVAHVTAKRVKVNINGQVTGGLAHHTVRPVSGDGAAAGAIDVHVLGSVVSDSAASAASLEGSTVPHSIQGAGVVAFTPAAQFVEGAAVTVLSGKYKDSSGVIHSVGNATAKINIGGNITGNLKFTALHLD